MLPWLSRAQWDELLRALRDAGGRIDHALNEALEVAWWDGARTGLALGLFAGVALGCLLTCLVIRARSNP